MAKDKIRQYLNDGQYYCLSMDPRDLIVIAGRGFGKGVIQAKRLQNAFQLMPGSMGGFISPSVKRCFTNILPSMLIHLERWGYKRDIHYTVGKRPAKALRWKQPIFTPDSWDNVISFYNGSCVSVISQDRKGTSNSLSLDYVIIDEAKFINYERLKDETFQANRGNENVFGCCHLHHGLTITTDIPVTKAGSWVLRYGAENDTELVEVMEGIIYRQYVLRKRLEINPHNVNVKKEMDYLNKELSILRKRCTLYRKYTSIDNLAILGEDFIRRQKRDLPAMTFRTSIMSEELEFVQGGFYSSFSSDCLYTAPSSSMANIGQVVEGGVKDDCRLDGDVEDSMPLVISFDANVNINWLIVGQVDSHDNLNVLKSFFVKYERKLPELVDDFIEYYQYHSWKQVVFYYDATFVGNNYALHNNDFHSEIEHLLRCRGWIVSSVFIGSPMQHVQKAELINRMLRGRSCYRVRINRDNNKDLIMSISSAGVISGKKDKRAEKYAETEEDKLESRTDGSDAFDTLCIGVEKFPQYLSGRGFTISY